MSSIQSKPEYDLNFFGVSAALPSEDRPMYERLFHDVEATIGPKDVFENQWVFDATHQIWEAFRFRRIAAQLLTSCKRLVIEDLLKPIIDAADANNPLGRPHWSTDTPERLATRYIQGEEIAIQKVGQMLLGAGINPVMIEAEAFATRSLELQRITQLLAKAELRRNGTLKAIERHRTGLGAQLQETMAQLETDEVGKARAAKAGTAPKLAA
jgi:hypothetical protein